MKPTYARKGEAVTCENGHVIATFSRDALCGEAFRQSSFLCGWTQPEPRPGDADIVCRTCGAPFYEGLALHVGGEYRYATAGHDASPTGLRGAMRPGLGAHFTHEAPA